MTEMLENPVTLFFMFMTNRWSEERCHEVFDEVGLGCHFWNKWKHYLEKDTLSYNDAVYWFYIDMTEANRTRLMRHAIRFYAPKAFA